MVRIVTSTGVGSSFRRSDRPRGLSRGRNADVDEGHRGDRAQVVRPARHPIHTHAAVIARIPYPAMRANPLGQRDGGALLQTPASSRRRGSVAGRCAGDERGARTAEDVANGVAATCTLTDGGRRDNGPPGLAHTAE